MMVTISKIPRATLWLGLLLFIGACEDYPGSCPTDSLDPQGDIYNIRVYNCDDSVAIVKVNDRPIGEIAAYDAEMEECTAGDVGAVPQCVEGKIQVDSTNVESVVVKWTETAVTNSANNCWVDFVYGAELRETVNVPDYVDPPISSSMECDMDNMDGFDEIIVY